MTFTTKDLSPKIGAEIKADRAALLDGSLRNELRKLLHARGVLLLRQLNISDGELRAFTETLGTIGLDYNPMAMLDVLLSNPPVYEKGAFYWHIDDITEDVPNFGSVICSRKLAPKGGGQTEWCNVAQAYDDLPATEKKEIENLKVVHSFEWSQRIVAPWPTYAELQTWQQFKPRAHPLVWKHPSGRKSLVLGSTASHVEGMGLEEGRALICRLTEWATQPHYVYSHDWVVGDVLIWDNTTTLHRAQPYEIGCGRANTRFVIAGEEPVTPVSAHERQLEHA
jgi:alpha-ketoglutarate-dependent taurine dioxygenase